MKHKAILIFVTGLLLAALTVGAGLADTKSPNAWHMEDVVCTNGYTTDVFVLTPGDIGQLPDSNITTHPIEVYVIDPVSGEEFLFYKNPGKGFKNVWECWGTTPDYPGAEGASLHFFLHASGPPH